MELNIGPSHPAMHGTFRVLVRLDGETIKKAVCEIGYLLAREWQIPETLCEAIRDHHTIREDISPQSPAGILQISEYIIGQLDFTVKEGIPVILAPLLTEHIQQNIDEYTVLAEDVPEEIERARKLYEH
jgi:hypothetical protein